MTQEPFTKIKLASYGQLVLVLQDKTGAECEILLAEGHEAEVLKEILKAQQGSDRQAAKPEVGQMAGPTWRHLLENGLLQSQIKRLPASSPVLAKKLESNCTAEELGV